MDYKEIIELILDEDNTTVGGGSSSAIAGAMACGLMGMVANLSRGKDYGYSDEEYSKIVKKLNDLKIELLQGSVDDNKAYELIVAAYKKPKSTDEEKEVRKKYINDAGVEAADVPLNNAKRNAEVLKIGKDLLEKSNPACMTDLKAGIDLAEMGLKAGAANVEVNLPLIKDEEKLTYFKDEIKKLKK